MWKSRSSIPRFDTSDELVKPPGFVGTDGRVPTAFPALEEAVAMAVGNTKDGSELPANLSSRERLILKQQINLPHLRIPRTIVPNVN